jgi:hypothetical protein
MVSEAAASSSKLFVRLYPQLHFTRTLALHSVFSHSYCLESGEYGSTEGLIRQELQLVQQCRYGQIDLYREGMIRLGAIGGVRAAYADLGPLSDLPDTLDVHNPNVPLGTVLLSLSLCKDKEALCVMTNSTEASGASTGMREVDPRIAEPLLTTGGKHELLELPRVGHVYLVRLATTSGNTGSLLNGTTLLAKLTILSGAPASSNDTYLVDWLVFYGAPAAAVAKIALDHSLWISIAPCATSAAAFLFAILACCCSGPKGGYRGIN